MMKIRKSSIWLCVAVFVLSGCGSGGNKSSSVNVQSAGGTNESSTIADIDVDKGLFNVTITVPKDLIGEITQAELDATVGEKGYKSATLNADGSVTYVMTKAQHKDAMDELKKSINESLAELVGSESTPNITSIEANDNYTVFTITTKNTSPDLIESFSALAMYMYGGLYAVYNGDTVDNIHVDFVNADSGEIISSADSRDMAETGSGDDSTEEMTLSGVYNWYVGEIWNPIVDFRTYIASGTDGTGKQFDADFAYDLYIKSKEETQKYTDFIHEKYPDITNAWDKMMEQVDIISTNLADGYETGSEKIDTDLLSQYNSAFFDYVHQNN